MLPQLHRGHPQAAPPDFVLARQFLLAPGFRRLTIIRRSCGTRLFRITRGRTIFEQKNVEVPADWSMTATNIVVSKYLHGQVCARPERESGVRALITRVAESIRDWGMAGGYFATPADAATFYAELSHLLLNQKVAFNSPVWFNVGCDWPASRTRMRRTGVREPGHGSRWSTRRPATRSRSARRASSTRWTTRWTRS